MRSVHDLAVADVHGDVGDRRVVEHQVARAARSEIATGTPCPDCTEDAWDSDTPAAAHEYIVRPEQSNESGPAAP